MDKECFVRLNQILREVSEQGGQIDDLDAIPTWFDGNAEDVNERMEEVQELLDDAHDNGMINRWVDDTGRPGPSTRWDWTTTAHRKASKMRVVLVNPVGDDVNQEDE